MDKYLVRLRQQARHCNLGAALEERLRDQSMEYLTDMELKKKLLETRRIPLVAILGKAKASEAAKKQMQCMTSGASVNAIGNREEKAGDQSGKKHVSFVGRRDISLGILVQQKEESVQSL